MTDETGGSPLGSISTSKSTLTTIVGAAISLIGSFLTWASLEGFGSVGGMEGGRDGWITFVLAIATAAVALFLKQRARQISIIVGAVLIVLVALVNIFDILGEELVDFSVGIGLWMVLIGGGFALAGAFIRD